MKVLPAEMGAYKMTGGFLIKETQDFSLIRVINKVCLYLSLVFFSWSLPSTSAMGTEWIAVAHGVSTGSALAAAIRKHAQAMGIDIKILHIKRGKFTADMAPSFKPEDYDELIELDPNESPEKSLQKLEKYHLRHPIFIGSEGLTWAYDLNHRLGFETLDPKSAEMVMNKNLLYQYLKDQGFSKAPYFEIKSMSELEEIQNDETLEFPLAVKPSNSSAGDGFKEVKDQSELTAYVKSLLNSTNIYHKSVQTVVIQPMFSGLHFAIQGGIKHEEVMITDVLEYEKLGAVYLRGTLLDPAKDSRVQTIVPHVQKFVRSLKGSWVFHIELIDDPKYGLVIYDVGPRLMGGPEHLMVKKATGFNQVEMYVEMNLSPGRWSSRLQSLKDKGILYPKYQHAVVLDWISRQRGIVARGPHLDLIRRISTNAGNRTSLKPLKTVGVTQNLLDTGGVSWFVGDIQSVERDVRVFRKAEELGWIYQLWGGPCAAVLESTQ